MHNAHLFGTFLLVCMWACQPPCPAIFYLFLSDSWSPYCLLQGVWFPWQHGTECTASKQDLPPISVLEARDSVKLNCLQACYRVVEVAQGLWHSPHPKAKDYIVRPKANGYQSLHLTLTVATAAAAASAAAVDGAALRSALEEDEVLPSQQEGAVFLELQIRTQGGHSICGCLQ